MNRLDFLNAFHHLRLPKQEADYPLRKQGRPAAVLIPLVEREDQLYVLLTQRALHLKHHPGQISFPGGGVDDDDADIYAAAKREAMEEVGIPPENISVVGALNDYRTISGYTITPVVAFVDPSFTPVIDTNEVDRIFEVPLAHLMNQANHLVHMAERHKKTFPIYFIPWNDEMIWGATAAILRNLSHHITP